MDAALCRYFNECNRSQAECTLAAMLRLYPPLRPKLPWAAARLKALVVARPPAHHNPLPWLQCVEIAYHQRCLGWPRRAAALLLQWLFGLRPTELTELCGRDLCPRSRHHWTGGVGFIKLGALRGTKSGRPQIVRAPHHEFWTTFHLGTARQLYAAGLAFVRLCERRLDECCSGFLVTRSWL